MGCSAACGEARSIGPGSALTCQDGSFQVYEVFVT
jgi:hypothetical protein